MENKNNSITSYGVAINDLKEVTRNVRRLNGHVYSLIARNREKCREHFTSFEKQLPLLQAESSQLIKSFQSLSGENVQFNLSLYKENLSSLVSLETFPFFILGLSELANANKAHLFAHEKGTKTVRLFFASRENEHAPPIVNFDQYKEVTSYLRSKKSKTLADFETLHLSGQHLHASVSTKFFDLLIILSKDEFLPFDDNESEFFSTIKNFSIPILEEMTSKFKKNISQGLTLNSLMSSPIKFVVANRSDLIIFKNFLENIPLEEFKKNSIHWKLSSSLTLFVNDPNSEQKISDISHYQRVSFLGELLNTLRHELSNPLFGLKLTIQTIEDEFANDRDTISEIENSIDRASEIIKSFSSLYSSNEAFTNVDLSKLVKESLTLCKSELKGIKREFTCDKSEPIFVNCNPVWLSQIIFNLIVNAAQALNSCEIKNPQINLEITNLDSKGIFLSVKDNGPGIPKENQRSIFDPFYTTKENGTGLGLPICKSLSERMGMTLELCSDGQSGTTFKLHIPPSSN